MRVLVKKPAAALLALTLMGTTPVWASDQTPEEMAVEGIAKILSAMELFLTSIPTYDAPEVLPNGDIIIRRRNPESPSEADDQESDESLKDIKA